MTDDTGGPIPADNYKFDYNDDGLDHSVRAAETFFEKRDLKNYCIYSDVNGSENN